MASLFDSGSDTGRIISICGDGDTHRRLVDLGLLGTVYTVKARRHYALLVDYGDFSAVTCTSLAEQIKVTDR